MDEDVLFGVLQCFGHCALKCTLYGYLLNLVYLSLFGLVGLYVLYKVLRFAFADADVATGSARVKKDALLGEVVWIIGASAGIGEAMAYKFIEAGAKVILSARRVSELQRVQQACKSKPGKYAGDVEIVSLDVMDYQSHKKLTEEAISKFGQVDYLVVNAGRSQRAIVEQTELEVDQEVMQLNFMGAISITKAVLPHMLERKKGHFVITSSLAGKIGTPVSASYAAAKFAVQGYFNSLRYEVAGRGIRITLACPGPTVSHGASNYFGAKKGEIPIVPVDTKSKVSTERCAKLIVAATVNKIDEAWIAKQPVLLFVYVAQYMPTFFNFMAKRTGPSRVEAFKRGDANINASILSFGSTKKSQ